MKKSRFYLSEVQLLDIRISNTEKNKKIDHMELPTDEFSSNL